MNCQDLLQGTLYLPAAPEGVRYAVLYSYAPGQPKDLHGRDSRAYGRLVARIRALTDAFTATHARFHLHVDASGGMTLFDFDIGFIRRWLKGHRLS
jgi:Ser/Thr protein kinase RdoA (MazF antagonist)